MRRSLLTALFLALLTALPFSFGFAQEQQQTQTTIFYGVDWESNVGLRSGATFKLGESDFYTAPYVRIGLDSGAFDNGLQTNKSVGIEVAWNIWSNPTGTIDLYLLAGAGIDWTELAKQNTQFNVTYGTQAGGALLVFDLPNTIPLFSMVFSDPKLGTWLKIRPQLFDSDTNWPDKLSGGFLILNGIG